MNRTCLKYARSLASLKLTIVCLSACMVIVVLGTIVSVKYGVYFAQVRVFQSWFVTLNFDSGLALPVFPGGRLLGAVLLANLISALFVKMKWKLSNLSLPLLHVGIIVMLLGGLLSDIYTESGYVSIGIGEAKDYIEDSTKLELALAETDSGAATAKVRAIPWSLLREGRELDDSSLPFGVIVRKIHQASQLVKANPAANLPAAASNGAGTQIAVRDSASNGSMGAQLRPPVSVVLEFVAKPSAPQLSGTWLLSDALNEPQYFDYAGKKWAIALRPKRIRKNFSVALSKFTHTVHPGTNIPRTFASDVVFTNTASGDKHEAHISMNKPYRFKNATFYQAGFAPDNSGTILQVVTNPAKDLPYLACIVISFGMIWRFVTVLVSRRNKKPTAKKNEA